LLSTLTFSENLISEAESGMFQVGVVLFIPKKYANSKKLSKTWLDAVSFIFLLVNNHCPSFAR